MKIEEFDYTNAKNEESHRKVMVVNQHKDYIDSIDFNKLDEKETVIAIEAQKEYEKKLQPIMKKAFRRFNKSNMKNLLIEEIK